jgi:3-deoxy-manno-octulosonate cytidylyltransferase (CMP-KDO synthetase)
MSKLPPCFGVIPARFASTRLPGKPLVDIDGKPMFWHVYTRAVRCAELRQVVLATDDDRIIAAARHLNVPVVKTRPDHPSGTDRTLEAARTIGVPETAVVVNIQGDEPLLIPQMLSQLVAPFCDEHVRVTTLARPITPEQALPASQVKVVLDNRRRALYFSRATIPYAFGGGQVPIYGHVGIYAFRLAALEHFVALGPANLEVIEKLEQLRLLENGIPIHVVETEYACHSVDTIQDLETVRAMIAGQQGEAKGINHVHGASNRST